MPGDKKKQKAATPVPRKVEAEKEKTPSTRARRSRVIPPREDSSEESSGPEDRLTSPIKPRVLKKRKQESAKPSDDRPKRIRRGNTPEPAGEITTPSRPQRTRGGGPTSASRSRKTELSEPKLPNRLAESHATPKGRPTSRSTTRNSPKVEKTEPKTIKRESHQWKESFSLWLDASVPLKNLDPTLDYDEKTWSTR